MVGLVLVRRVGGSGASGWVPEGAWWAGASGGRRVRCGWLTISWVHSWGPKPVHSLLTITWKPEFSAGFVFCTIRKPKLAMGLLQPLSPPPCPPIHCPMPCCYLPIHSLIRFLTTHCLSPMPTLYLPACLSPSRRPLAVPGAWARRTV